MKKFEGFEAKKSGGSFEKLPAGGYVARIMDANEVSYDWGSVIVIEFDIVEGQYKDFFEKDFSAQDREDKRWRGVYRLRIPMDDGSERDGWTKRSFGNAIWALEASNPGYHFDWDEKKFVGKLVGVLFRNREWEYNGNTGWASECCALTSVPEIRANTFKMPKDKPLNKPAGMSAVSDPDLPFEL